MGAIRLDCLGSGFAFSEGRYWNGWLLNGRVLLDCPPQALAHLYRLGKTPADIDLVLLSHEHSDHIGGIDLYLLDATYRQRHARGRPFAIAGPPGIYDRVRSVIGLSDRLPDRHDESIAWLEHEGGASFEWDGVAVETVWMVHPAPDLGYRIHVDGRVVAYTGDTAYGPHVLELARGAEVLIAECGGERRYGHMSWDDIRTLRAEIDPATHLIVTHYDPTMVPDLSDLERVTLAEDFAVYEF